MQLSLLILTLSSIILGSSIQKLPENMPFHTKILWGETGIIRKINLAPETRQKELLLRVKMLQLHQKLAISSLGLFFYQAYIGNQMANGNYTKYHDLHAPPIQVEQNQALQNIKQPNHK